MNRHDRRSASRSPRRNGALGRDGRPPTPLQCRLAREIVAWYLDQYHDTPSDIAVQSMCCDPRWVGHFAIGVNVRRGDADA